MPAPLRYAFETGYHTSVDTNTGEIRQQDGFIFSLVTFTFILPLAFSICLSHWITLNRQTHDVDSASLHLMITAYMVISIVIMLILRFSPHAECLYAENGEEDSDILQSTDSRDSQTRELRLSFDQFRNILRRVFWRIIRGALPLIGLVLFYAISIIHSMFRIASYSSCIDTYRECQLLRNYATKLAYQFVKISFMGVLMLFSIFFKKKVLLQCCVTRFSLVLIMTATATLWLDISIYEARYMSLSDRDILANKCHPLNSSLSKFIDWKCVNEETDLFDYVEYMTPYFCPVYIEFLLLCIGIIIKLFFSMKPAVVIQSLKQRGRTTSHASGHGNGNLDSKNERQHASATIMTQDDNLETGNDDPDANSQDIENSLRELTNDLDSSAAEGKHGVAGAVSSARVRQAAVEGSMSPETSPEPDQHDDDPSVPLLGTGQSVVALVDGAVSYGTITANQPGHGNNNQLN